MQSRHKALPAAAWLVLALVLVLASSCNLIPVDKEKAAQAFTSWLRDNGVPTMPSEPMVGLDLGEVAAGAIIGSYSPLTENGKGVEAGGYRGLKAISQKGRLFYLDEMPGAFYEHPGRIVVVGALNQILYSEKTEGWPVVNGVRPRIIDNPNSKDYIGASVFNPWQLRTPIINLKDWVITPHIPRAKGAVVVNGLRSNENLYAAASSVHGLVEDAMGELYTTDHVRTVESAVTVANPAQRIRDAVDELVTDESVTSMTIYIIAHGNIDHVGIGGYHYGPDDLRALIVDYPDVQFSVILETCHGGSWVNNFDGSDPTHNPHLDNLMLFIATTAPEKGAYPDWDQATVSGNIIYDHDTTDSYVEWTSDFLKKMAVASADPAYADVQAYANNNSIRDEWALYYFSYWRVKGSVATPPSGAGLNVGANTFTMTERAGVNQQEPMIYCQWLADWW